MARYWRNIEHDWLRIYDRLCGFTAQLFSVACFDWWCIQGLFSYVSHELVFIGAIYFILTIFVFKCFIKLDFSYFSIWFSFFKPNICAFFISQTNSVQDIFALLKVSFRILVIFNIFRLVKSTSLEFCNFYCYFSLNFVICFVLSM